MQCKDEDLKEIYERFQNTIEVLENYGSDIKNMIDLYKIKEKYNKLATDQKTKIKNIEKAKEGTREMFLGYGVLANCDKKKYGNLVEDLKSRYTFGNNKYPKTQQKADEYAMI